MIIVLSFVGCFFLLTNGSITHSLSFEHGEAHWGFMPFVYILFAGIVASALAFVIWNHILNRSEARKASISLLLVPVVGVISGCIFLHEDLKIVTVAGILLVLVGIWFVNSKSNQIESNVVDKAPIDKVT